MASIRRGYATPGIGIGDALDLDRVLPAVAEVVEIFERLHADVFEDIDEAGLARVERATAPVGVGNTPSDVAGADLVEMAVGPAHCRLDDQMQPVEPDCERHLDAAQNRGLDVGRA